jgi:hypothetical protein
MKLNMCGELRWASIGEGVGREWEGLTTERPSEHHRNLGIVSTKQRVFFVEYLYFLFSA